MVRIPSLVVHREPKRCRRVWWPIFGIPIPFLLAVARGVGLAADRPPAELPREKPNQRVSASITRTQVSLPEQFSGRGASQLPLSSMLTRGKLLFMVSWTEQEGRGRPT